MSDEPIQMYENRAVHKRIHEIEERLERLEKCMNKLIHELDDGDYIEWDKHNHTSLGKQDARKQEGKYQTESTVCSSKAKRPVQRDTLKTETTK